MKQTSSPILANKSQRTTFSTKPQYCGGVTPLLEQLTDREWTPQRSRLVDQWLVYADAEGFNQGGVR